MSRSDILEAFPNINNGQLELTSPATPKYNCIAYAADDHHRWWWPDPDGICYWPPSAQRAVRLAAFQQAFETLGYKLTDNHDVEAGKQKIAIFCKDSLPTHASKQLSDGSWSSKLGKLEDISHDKSGVEGATYGTITLVMERGTSAS